MKLSRILLRPVLSRVAVLQGQTGKACQFSSSSQLLEEEYDLLVIGGGSGGLACAKEAADFGAKAAVLDLVTPSPHGTTWGLGGTCVNVGCIPKKLMHHAALIGKDIKEAKSYGWRVEPGSVSIEWQSLVSAVTDHVGSLNWGHRVALRDKRVKYLNASGSLVDRHTVLARDKKGVETTLKARHIVLATGGRPKYPSLPGAELAITSDDLFRLRAPPGRTLCVGGSYVSLECAGFLTGLGFDTSVLLRSIPLRGFDQQMAGLVVDAMEVLGTRILRGAEPQSLEKTADGKIRVSFTPGGESQLPSEEFDTVLMAVGRAPDTHRLGLARVGVDVHPQTGKILTQSDRTTVDNIHAIGDIVHGGPELTPVAIKAGHLLAARLFGGAEEQMDYEALPTTVFTPLEYSCAGLSEETARSRLGDDNIEVYHAFYRPLEYAVPSRPSDQCYVKAVCERASPQRVLGLHFTGPNAGEVMQGLAVAMRCGLTMRQLHASVGIHPTCAEEVVKLHITKRSGLDPTVTGC